VLFAPSISLRGFKLTLPQTDTTDWKRTRTDEENGFFHHVLRIKKEKRFLEVCKDVSLQSNIFAVVFA
jgi:hypothetical protein